MQWVAAAAIGLAWIAMSCGCGRTSAPASAGAAKPAIAREQVATIDNVQPASDAGAASKPSPQSPVDASVESDEEPPTDSGKELRGDAETDEPAARERIALLTLGGPLVVDVRLTTDGRSHVEVFEEHVSAMLDAADTDKDGRETWKELAGNEAFLKGKLPQGMPSGDRLAEMWTERYDFNRDRRIQRVEAAAWLGMDAGRSAKAFEVRSSRSYFPNPRATSRVWQLLDTDRDGELAASEIDQAPAKLWSLDADDDRMIAPPELATLRQLLEAAGGETMRPSRDANRDAAIHLEPRFDVDRLEYVLIDLYSPRRQLGRSSFSGLTKLYDALDSNEDGALEGLELADILDVEAQLELAIDFGKAGAARETAALLALRQHAPEIVVVAQPTAERLILALGKTRLIVSAHDIATPASPNQYGPPGQLRMMVHDQCDALGEALDANGDALLGEREIASISDQLTKWDADGDGALAADELPYSLIVAFLRGEQPQEQSFYLPTFAAAPGARAESPAWFRDADFNGDGDISRREFLGSLEQFAALDADADGYISAGEVAPE